MKFRGLLYTFFTAAAVFSLVLSSSSTGVDAKGPNCIDITSSTIPIDPNGGYIQFDAENGGADLSILPGADPSDDDKPPTEFPELAACVAAVGENIFQIQQYAWNTNGGYVNFSGCPQQDWCKVDIVDADGDGDFEVTGQAWNELFGYIYFDGATTDGTPFGVTLEASAALPGLYQFSSDSAAWTQSGIWLGFGGPRVMLPDSCDPATDPDCGVCDPATDPDCGVCDPATDPDCGVCDPATDPDCGVCDPATDPDCGVCDPATDPDCGVCDPATDPDCGTVVETDFCDGKPWICIEVELDVPEAPELGFTLADSVAIADGQSGYDVYVYLRDGDGNALVDGADFDLDSFDMDFDWVDTVKLNQLHSQTGQYHLQEYPVTTDGGVVYKPVDLQFSDLTLIDAAQGKYALDEGEIRSIAPTSNMNVSKISGVQSSSAFLVQNEEFFVPLSSGGQAWTDNIESNDLILKSVNFTLNDEAGDPVLDLDGDAVHEVALYANGAPGLSLPFRPAVEVHELYVNDSQNVIAAATDIPFWITAKARELGMAVLKSDPKVSFKVDYSATATKANCSFDGENYSMHFGGVGENLSQKTKSDITWTQLLSGQVFSAVAEMPVKGPNVCPRAEGPSVYTQVEYPAEVSVPTGVKEVIVKYYHNKLPRFGGGVVSNSQIYVSGLVKGYTAKSKLADVQPVTTSGDVNVSVVRSTIHENLSKYGKGDPTPVSNGHCNIFALDDTATVTSCGAEGVNYYDFDIGDENIFYTKSDIALDLSTGSWGGKWIIVSDGGHISIDSDLYNGDIDESNHLAIVAFKDGKDDIGESGNVYIYPEVKNIQATTIADGSLFSCFGHTDTCLDESDSGLPEGTVSDLVNNLQNQLLYQGNIASKNTIGGFNYNQNYDFRLLASGEIIEEGEETPALLYQAMMEDLNFLRMFKLEVQVTAEGLPVDQSCKKGLTAQEQKQIVEGELVVNDFGDDDALNDLACDGIDASSVWTGNACLGGAADDVPCGDLFVDPSDSRRAQGVFASGLSEEERNLPVLVIYTKIPESVIFSDRGAVLY